MDEQDGQDERLVFFSLILSILSIHVSTFVFRRSIYALMSAGCFGDRARPAYTIRSAWHAVLFCFMYAPVALDDDAALLPFKKWFHFHAPVALQINLNRAASPRSIQRPMLDERLEITLLFRQARRIGTDDHNGIDRPHKLRGQRFAAPMMSGDEYVGFQKRGILEQLVHGRVLNVRRK